MIQLTHSPDGINVTLGRQYPAGEQIWMAREVFERWLLSLRWPGVAISMSEPHNTAFAIETLKKCLIQDHGTECLCKICCAARLASCNYSEEHKASEAKGENRGMAEAERLQEIIDWLNEHKFDEGLLQAMREMQDAAMAYMESRPGLVRLLEESKMEENKTGHVYNDAGFCVACGMSKRDVLLAVVRGEPHRCQFAGVDPGSEEGSLTVAVDADVNDRKSFGAYVPLVGGHAYAATGRTPEEVLMVTVEHLEKQPAVTLSPEDRKRILKILGRSQSNAQRQHDRP